MRPDLPIRDERGNWFLSLLDAIDFFAKPIAPWPRWARRTYIVTWPLSALIKFTGFFVTFVVLLIILAVLFPIGLVGEWYDNLDYDLKDARRDIRKNWNNP